MLTQQQARYIIESKQEVSIKYCTKDCGAIEANKVVCSSSFFDNNTFNLIYVESRVVRTVKSWNIFELNG